MASKKSASKFLTLGAIILLIIFAVYAIYKYAFGNSSKIIKCNMKFGLCPAAKCIPYPYED